MTGAALSEAQLIEIMQRFQQLEDTIEDAQLMLASLQEDQKMGPAWKRVKTQTTRDNLDAFSERSRDDMVAMQDLIRKLQA